MARAFAYLFGLRDVQLDAVDVKTLLYGTLTGVKSLPPIP